MDIFLDLFLLVLDLDAPAPRATTKHEQPADMFELALPADFMLHYSTTGELP